ncbi:MAG: LacI family transcriptional regulator [Hyphomicrobiales bacterium]|nr:MAG: LacI family transcriptional regulator [Hyphomicrobiales bacterium]
MEQSGKRRVSRSAGAGRSVTIKDLAAELGLSITTISRALNGYSDVGEKTRKRVAEAAQKMGYRPNRNAQRLVTQRTHNFAWVQSDNDRKFVDPHFVEVMAGVLRGARAGGYDILLTSDTPEHEIAVYDRYVNDNSVDGFIIDLPREGDPRISYLLDVGRPFVVHGRDDRAAQYGWVDIDNFGNFYNLTRLMLSNGHRHIAFVNGDEHFNYARHRRQGVEAALADAGLPAGGVKVLNSLHPMGEAGFKLTETALSDPSVTAILYSSSLMAVEGHAAVLRAGRDVAIATMDDELHYIDLSPFAGQFTTVRSSLRDAGAAVIAELIRQCEQGGTPGGHLVPSSIQLAQGMDGAVLKEPVPR